MATTLGLHKWKYPKIEPMVRNSGNINNYQLFTFCSIIIKLIIYEVLYALPMKANQDKISSDPIEI